MYVARKTDDVDAQTLQHFFGEFADGAVLRVGLASAFFKGLLDLGGEVLCEVEEGTAGAVLGVEVQL